MPLSREDNILFYDGFCNLCSSFTGFIIARDKAGKNIYVPLQSEEAKEFLTPFNIDTTKLDTFVYHTNGKVYTRSSAALRALRGVGGLWVLMSVFLIIPPFLRNAIYNFVGRNRYKWFGKRDACFLPPRKKQD